MNRYRSLTVLAIVAASALTLSACASADSAPAEPADSTTPAAATAPADGIVVGDGPVSVELWTDVSCPYCAALDEQTGDDIAAWVDDGTITFTLHPMNYVSAKRGDTTDYSTRGANLLALTAQAGELEAVLPLYALLQEHQVDADGAPTDADLLAYAAEAGVAADLTAGVEQLALADWVEESNDHWVGEVVGSDTPVDHVPLLVIDGQTFEMRGDGTDAARLRDAVEAARG
ncbi:DsbA family protein [Microbacterium sp. zg.Y625]|uniref:DsbA family protein n=1 Tax=Microbacterium jiangjiandongii TaxID=3049071 RepID=UPI00214AEB12|nr:MULTISPECIES: DsbA family protein [unclassified Microbacterium]MCR2792113.1 DsbA family protein [Microbacterium sp. zg.Y625]WIM24919.1 DsbA family protein [Microbacterium sp. zg-Y625]